MKIGMSALALAIVVIGFFPNLILDRFIIPVLNNFILDPHFIEHHLVGLSFWTAGDFFAVFLALAIAFLLFWLGMRTGAFQTSLPAWLSQEYAGTLIGRGSMIAWGYLTLFFQAMIHFFKVIIAFLFRGTFGFLQKLDYKPGQSKAFRTINFGNIDFDVALVIIIFGVILIFLFWLQFGLQAVTGNLMLRIAFRLIRQPPWVSGFRDQFR